MEAGCLVCRLLPSAHRAGEDTAIYVCMGVLAEEAGEDSELADLGPQPWGGQVLGCGEV